MEKKTPATFVEIVPAAADDRPECIIEFEDTRGKKMRMQFRGAGVPDWIALGRLFWSSRG
jgi:hypothetical protein